MLLSVSDSNLIKKSLPWNYDFKFVVEEISNVNDKAQVSKKRKQAYLPIKMIIISQGQLLALQSKLL